MFFSWKWCGFDDTFGSIMYSFVDYFCNHMVKVKNDAGAIMSNLPMCLLEMIQCWHLWHSYKTNWKLDALLSSRPIKFWVTVLDGDTCLSVCGMMCVPFHVGLSEDKDIYLFSEGVSVLNEWGAYPSLTVEHSPHQVWNSSGPGLRHMITPCQDHCEQLFYYWSLFKWKSETLIDDKINHISKLLSMVSPVSKNICIMSGVLLTWTLETESRSDKRESLNFIEVQY